MSWRDRLQPASVRGVPFHVEDTSGQGGRRVVLHEYPLQEFHDTEDLGAKTDGPTINGFVIGPDFDLELETLLEALNAPGPCTLVHPHKGTLRIQVTDVQWSIKSRRGGYGQVTFSYYPAGKRQPVASQSSAAALASAATAVNASTQAAFAEAFDVSGQPAFVVESATNQLQEAVTSLRTLNGKISAQLAPLQDVAADIDSLGNELSTLIKQPATLVNQLAAVISSLMGAYTSVNEAFRSYQHLQLAFAIGNPISTTAANGTETANRVQMATNQQAISSALSNSTTTAMASMVAQKQVPFTSYDEAVAVRDALLAALESQAAVEIISYDEYAAISDLQMAIMQRIDEVAPNLRSIEYVSFNASLPALVIAYQVYGDASRADELASRNGISNPLFMPAGTDIEVLQ